MTPNELISIVSNNLGDGGFVALNREEYIQFVNDVAHDIWFRSKAMHVVRQYALPEDSHYIDLTEDDIIEFEEMQVRTQATPIMTPPGPEPAFYEFDKGPVHQREKPHLQNVQNGYGIWTNVGDIEPTYHLSVELRDGRYRITSPRKFGAGLILQIFAVIHSPRFTWLTQVQVDPTANPPIVVNLTDQQRIWEPFRNVFIEGCTWRAARRLANFTQDSTRSRIWQDAQNLYYRQYLPDAIHFVHSIKDGTTALFVEPFQYLTDRRP